MFGIFVHVLKCTNKSNQQNIRRSDINDRKLRIFKVRLLIFCTSETRDMQMNLKYKFI